MSKALFGFALVLVGAASMLVRLSLADLVRIAALMLGAGMLGAVWGSLRERGRV